MITGSQKILIKKDLTEINQTQRSQRKLFCLSGDTDKQNPSILIGYFSPKDRCLRESASPDSLKEIFCSAISAPGE